MHWRVRETRRIRATEETKRKDITSNWKVVAHIGGCKREVRHHKLIMPSNDLVSTFTTTLLKKNTVSIKGDEDSHEWALNVADSTDGPVCQPFRIMKNGFDLIYRVGIKSRGTAALSRLQTFEEDQAHLVYDPIVPDVGEQASGKENIRIKTIHGNHEVPSSGNEKETCNTPLMETELEPQQNTKFFSNGISTSETPNHKLCTNSWRILVRRSSTVNKAIQIVVPEAPCLLMSYLTNQQLIGEDHVQRHMFYSRRQKSYSSYVIIGSLNTVTQIMSCSKNGSQCNPNRPVQLFFSCKVGELVAPDAPGQSRRTNWWN